MVLWRAPSAPLSTVSTAPATWPPGPDEAPVMFLEGQPLGLGQSRQLQEA